MGPSCHEMDYSDPWVIPIRAVAAVFDLTLNFQSKILRWLQNFWARKRQIHEEFGMFRQVRSTRSSDNIVLASSTGSHPHVLLRMRPC